MNIKTTMKTIDVLKLFRRAWKLYRNNFPAIMKIVSINIIIGLLITLMNITNENIYMSYYPFISIIIFLISAWINIALVITINGIYLQRNISFKESFFSAKDIYLKYLGITILYFMIVFTGFFLFIIPGIYWLVIYSLAILIVIIEKDNYHSFRRSKLLVRDFYWSVLLIGIIFLIIYSPSIITSYIYSKHPHPYLILFSFYNALSFSFTATVSVILYYTLKSKNDAALIETSDEPEKEYSLFRIVLGLAVIIAISLIILFIFIFFLSSILN